MGSAEPKPEISVIMVSDYAAGEGKSWDNLRRTLTALSRQDFAGTAEFLVLEHESIAAEAPQDLFQIAPCVRVVPSPQFESYALKNHGMQEARADIIAILDSDCSPDPDWLRRIAAAWKAHPEASVISGRTMYESRGMLNRLSALLSRAYVDRGKVGTTPYVSNNNSTWRRSVYLEHPLPTGLGPFAGRIQSEGLRRAGGLLLFDPSIRVIHEF